MTTEEKAKAYDKALEKARLLCAYPTTKPFISDLQDLFPELAEPDDERVRKGLIELVKQSSEILEKKNQEQMIDWLEKQGEHDSIEEPNFFDDFRKTDSEVEPKFHEGEWITNGDYTWQIVNVTDLDYILQSQDGNIVDDTISYVDEQFHSFTIQDAKDGDFLVCGKDKSPFIFKGFDRFHPNCPVAYCGICEDGTVGICTGDSWWTDEEVFPATKKQHEQLEKAISDAGYIWDTENKQLKEIDYHCTGVGQPKEPTGTLKEMLDDKEMKELLQTEYEKGKADAVAEMQKSWSEKDEKQLNDIMWIIEAYRKNGFNETHIQIADNSENWLKSLKYRVQPKQEWSEEDEKVLHSIKNALNYEKPRNYLKLRGFKFTDILDWLKSLRPQNNITDEELAQAKKEAYNDALDKIEYHSGEPTFDDGWSAAIWYLKKRNAQPRSQWKPSDRDIKLLRELSDGKICPDNYRTRLYEIINNLKFL